MSVKEADEVPSAPSIRSATPTFVSPSRESSVQPVSDGSSYQMQLITLLNIPKSLTTRPKAVDIRLAYSKYEAIQKAQKDLFLMIEDGTWNIRTPSTDQVVELFVSKSVWHGYYRKYFPKVEAYPLLVKWLRKDPDAPSNVTIFGKERNFFNFKDLIAALQELDKGQSRKRKAKESDDDGIEKKKKKKGKGRKKKASDSEST
jgi:hypothetical protein